MVQKYIDTGPKPYCIRVGTFLAKTIYSYTSGSNEELAARNAETDRLEAGASMWPPASERKRQLIVDEDAILHRAFGSVPLLGIHLLRDRSTGQLYVLEVNAGGNTWHFTSRIGEPSRRSLSPKGPGSDASLQGRLALLGQFGAFDIAAKVLVAKTRELPA